MKAVYPKDWVVGRPYETVGEADRYYAGIATKVMGLLRRSCISDVFPEEDLFESAMCLAGWFEDLCSEIGIWRVANEEYRRRYGAVLPFYDVSNYYEGEPNLQDVQLLLWHLVQTINGNVNDLLINPENPGIATVAHDLCKLFEDEYETAPANTRLYDFVHDPELATDWWKCRRLIQWFTLSSYIFPFKRIDLEVEFLRELEFDEEEDDDDFFYKKNSPFLYELMLQSVFSDRDNLLSMTSPKWCGRITGVDDLFACKRLLTSVYRYEGRNESQFLLRDEDDGTLYEVENESVIDISEIDKLKKGVSRVIVTLTTFGKRIYLCGTIALADDNILRKYTLDAVRAHRSAQKNSRQVLERFLKASGGTPMVFCKDMEEAIRFVEKKMRMKKNNDVLPEDMDDVMGCVTLLCDAESGITIMGEMTRCIASPDNPYYDKAFAEKNATNLFVNHEMVSYRMACMLFDKGYLPDAAMNSLLGDAHGRDFLHQHGQFFLDYFYERYCDDDSR